MHEPKGVATAPSGDVYISDGAGSGVWTNIHHISVHSDATQTASSQTWTDIAFEKDGIKDGIIHSTSTNNERVTIAQAGDYIVHYSIEADSASGTTIVEVRIVINGTELDGSPKAATLGASDQKSLGGSIAVTLAANDIVKLQFYGSTANATLTYPGSGATSKPTAGITINQVVF